MADQGTRESFNRLMGLGSYAGGVIVLGLMALGLYSDGGFMGDYQTYGIGLAAALIMFAIGFTTGRRGKK
jgi:hypothetical protein